jgi:hypothetical protein
VPLLLEQESGDRRVDAAGHADDDFFLCSHEAGWGRVDGVAVPVRARAAILNGPAGAGHQAARQEQICCRHGLASRPKTKSGPKPAF